ncbi:MAG: hypothetical protein ABI675_19375 [Chitinophagaceae bacterium]
MKRKRLKLETNFNHKLHCDKFLHIALAPVANPSVQDMEETIFEINVADKSHPDVQVKLEFYSVARVAMLSNIHTWASHGMTTTEFINWLFLKHPELNRDSHIGVYYYAKVKAMAAAA